MRIIAGGGVSVANLLALLVALIALAAMFLLVSALRGDMTRLRTRLDALERRPAVSNDVPTHNIEEGLPVGILAPAFSLPGPRGETESLDMLRAVGPPVLLVFWKVESPACMDLLPDIVRWQRDYAAAVTVGCICCDTTTESRALLTAEGCVHVATDTTSEGAEAYHVWATPSAVLVHAGGVTGSPLAVGAEAIRDLATGVLGLPARPRGQMPVITPFWQRGGRPRRSPAIHDELLADGSMVLYHTWRQKIMALNATGALIWECCDGEHDLAMIVHEVRDVYPDARNVEDDVPTLLRQLHENRMIDPVYV